MYPIEYHLPFTVKLNHLHSGVGPFIASSNESKLHLLADIIALERHDESGTSSKVIMSLVKVVVLDVFTQHRKQTASTFNLRYVGVPP